MNEKQSLSEVVERINMDRKTAALLRRLADETDEGNKAKTVRRLIRKEAAVLFGQTCQDGAQ